MILRKNARQSQLCDGGNAPEAKALPPALQVQRYNVFFKFAAKQKYKFTPPVCALTISGLAMLYGGVFLFVS